MQLVLVARCLLLVAVLSSLLIVVPGDVASAVPSGFRDQVVFDDLTLPTAVAFSPDGRVYVAEKSGLVKVFDGLEDTTPRTFADLRTNVHDYLDRGLLGLAVDPDVRAPRSVHVLYSHDAPIGGRAPVHRDGCGLAPNGDRSCLASGRLSRLLVRADGTAGSEDVLIEDWCGVFPSHAVGALVFGDDGALYASGGDGAHPGGGGVDYGQRGHLNACGDPPVRVGATPTPPTAEGGSLRAQDLRTSGDPVTLDGTIIRVDPDTGAPWPGNPLGSHSDVNARQIIASGLRNPFRFAVRPGTSEVWVGDVGRFHHEEINVVPPPRSGTPPNFGWPCYEGGGRQASFDQADLAICENLYRAGPSAVTAPVLSYGHTEPITAQDDCVLTRGDSVTGGTFYEGGPYPDRYDGAYFFADYARGCLWAMPAGAGGRPDPAAVQPFASDLGGVVDLKTGPGGDVFYVNILAGEVRRISYSTGNQPPVAVAAASPTSGPLPLTVSFDGSGSRDPEGGTLRYAWDLDGDGAYDDATGPRPTRTYTRAGPVTVGLRVTDPGGATGADTVRIAPGSSPPNAFIAAPGSARRWAVGESIAFSGSATDGAGRPLGTEALSWQVVLHHCGSGSAASDCHVHPVQRLDGVASGSFGAIDHGYPSYLTLRLVATDPASGLTDTVDVRLDPRTVDLAFTSSPPGLTLHIDGVDGTTPFRRRVIVGATVALAAPSPQAVDGSRHTFSAWSDGGGATHDVRAPERDTTFHAVYEPPPPPVVQPQPDEPSPVTPSGVPTVTIDAPSGNAGWRVDQPYAFSGSAVDAAGAPLPATALRWTVIHHTCATAAPDATCTTDLVDRVADTDRGTFTVTDSTYPSYVTVAASATDPATGRSAMSERRLDPHTVPITLTTTPPGRELQADGAPVAAPATVPAVVGGSVQLNAPSPQVAGSTSYEFVSWSDGGAASHEIVVPPEPVTYSAAYRTGVAVTPAADGGVVLVPVDTPEGRLTVALEGVSGPGTLLLTPGPTPDARGLAFLGSAWQIEIVGFQVDGLAVTLPYAPDPLQAAGLVAEELELFGLPGGERPVELTQQVDEGARTVSGDSADLRRFAIGSYRIDRIGGGSRVETAVRVSEDTFSAGVPVAYLAHAGDFPDALSGGPAAAADGGPILLTDADQLSPAAAAELDRLQPGRIVVLGGTQAVSATVAEQLEGHTDGAVDRIGGADRFDTSARIAAASTDPEPDVVYVATGQTFPDALAGGAAAARDAAPVLLVARDEVPQPVAAELTRLQPAAIVVLGGTAAIADGVAEQLQAHTEGPVHRLAGATRYETAARIAAEFPGPVDTAFVATGVAFPDALSAVPAAGRSAGPVVLAEPAALPDGTRDQLADLRPGRMVVLGGVHALSAEVPQQLERLVADPRP